MKCGAIIKSVVMTIFLLSSGAICEEQTHNVVPRDDSLVVHYRFDSGPGDSAGDLSGFGNDGRIIDGEYLPEVEGRLGVLRLNGKTSYIDCSNLESMQFMGDRSFEMWVRFNELQNEPNYKWSLIYGEYPPDKFAFNMSYTTLFKHSDNSVLAIVSNLSRKSQDVMVRFNLSTLGLTNLSIDVLNPLSREKVPMTVDGVVSIPLESEAWLYLWLRPRAVN